MTAPKETWSVISKNSALSITLVVALLTIVGTGAYWTGYRTRGTEDIKATLDRHIQLGGHSKMETRMGVVEHKLAELEAKLKNLQATP